MIHTLIPSDLPELLALSKQARWEHTLEDWQSLLKAGKAYGHRNENGNAISSCVITSFGPTMASLGMLIVSKENRRLGLATDLMRHAINQTTPAGQPLAICSGRMVEGFYERFGFRRVESLSKLIAGPEVEVPDSGFSSKIDIRRWDAQNFERVAALDAQVHGCNRRGMLKTRANQAVSKTIMLKQGGETLLGYGMGVLQGDKMQIGPVIAFNRFTAQEIIRELIQDYEGSVRIDVMEQRRDLTDELLEAGFEEVDRQPIMLLGGKELHGRRDHIFSPVSQAWIA